MWVIYWSVPWSEQCVCKRWFMWRPSESEGTGAVQTREFVPICAVFKAPFRYRIILRWKKAWLQSDLDRQSCNLPKPTENKKAWRLFLIKTWVSCSSWNCSVPHAASLILLEQNPKPSHRQSHTRAEEEKWWWKWDESRHVPFLRKRVCWVE